MMPPPPKVTKLNGELSLLGEPEDDAVAAGREAFALLYQEVASLSAEVPSPSAPHPLSPRHMYVQVTPHAVDCTSTSRPPQALARVILPDLRRSLNQVMDGLARSSSLLKAYLGGFG